jgi:hypothetical protein
MLTMSIITGDKCWYASIQIIAAIAFIICSSPAILFNSSIALSKNRAVNTTSKEGINAVIILSRIIITVNNGALENGIIIYATKLNLYFF